MKNPFLLYLAQLFFISIGIFACHKSKEEQKPHAVTYTMYSTQPNFNFVHCEKDQWKTEQVSPNHYSVTLDVQESDFNKIQRIENTTLRPQLDSFYLRADMDGKSQTVAFSYFNSQASCAVQLSQLK